MREELYRHKGFKVGSMGEGMAELRARGFKVIDGPRVESGTYIERALGKKPIDLHTLKMRGPDGNVIELLTGADAEDHIAFTVEDMAKTAGNLLKAGYKPITAGPTYTPGKVWIQFFRNGSGSLVELVQEAT